MMHAKPGDSARTARTLRDVDAERVWLSGYRSRVDRSDPAASIPWCLLDLEHHRWDRCILLPGPFELIGVTEDAVFIRTVDELELHRVFRIPRPD